MKRAIPSGVASDRMTAAASDRSAFIAAEWQAYEELQCYTLARGDMTFIHQHIVDAWTAQCADGTTKRVGLTFALVGLHLHVDRGYTGRQVQRAHMDLARRSRDWSQFPLPHERGTVTPRHVMRASAGPARDAAIDAWCASVWQAFAESHEAVADLLDRHGVARR